MVSSTPRVSPSCTLTSITSTSSLPPMSGTVITSTLVSVADVAPLGAAAAGGSAAGAAGASAGSGFSSVFAEAPSPDSVSICANTSPSLMVWPMDTVMAFTTPLNGAGTSTVALSDSNTTMVSSFSTWVPGDTVISITSTPSVPPRSGTKTSFTATVALLKLKVDRVYWD